MPQQHRKLYDNIMDYMRPMSLFCFCARITTIFIMQGMTVILEIHRPIRLRASLSDNSHTTQKYTQHRT